MVDPKLFTQVDLEQEIVPPLEVIPTCIDVETPKLILYKDVMGENPLRLAYRAVDVRHNGEYILDAVTGRASNIFRTMLYKNGRYTMKKKFFAAITAFLLTLTPLTAHAGVILVEPQEPVNLEDYTTSYDAMKETGGITFSDNQVLLYWQLPVMREGCEVTPNTMEWEITGTADVTYKTGNLGKDVSYEEIYALSYCLITANSPGSVHVVGTEYSLYDSDGTEFYFNFTVDADGNFEETVDLDNPIEPIVSKEFVYFPKPDLPCEFSLIVSSNLESTAVHDNDGCITFTPEEDGRYVVSTRAYCEEIVECGVAGHFHYFYPILNNYTVEVTDGDINVELKGSKSWYSEQEVNMAAESLAACDVVGACYDVYAADPDDVLNVNYFSFVNGQLPDGENGYDSYITNIYYEYGTESYFCVNYFYSDVATTIPLDRVTALEQDISSLEINTWASSWCSGDLDLATDDYMEFSRIAAPEDDGNLTVIVDGTEEYPLTVENGIFHHRIDMLGDCNADGDFSVADVVLLQKWLLAVPDTHLANWKAADFCEDDRLDVFDLCLMKRALIEKMNGISQNVDTSFKLQSVGDIRTNGDNHTNWTGYIARSKNDLLDIIQENEGVSADEISLEDIDASAFNDKSLIIIYGICTAGNSYSIIDDISIKGTDIDVSMQQNNQS